MEEGGRVEGTDKSHTWHIDPLDATTNFLHAIPIFAVSIALEREGQIVAGVIYNPADDDMYVDRKRPGRLGRQPSAARRPAHRTVAGRCSAAAFPTSARRRSIRASRPSSRR